MKLNRDEAIKIVRLANVEKVDTQHCEPRNNRATFKEGVLHW
jgi:hypothetical protein